MAMTDILPALQALIVATTLSTSAAIGVVLLLRRWLRATSGAGIAYTSWLLVPIALVGALLPQADGDGGGMVTTAMVVTAPIRSIATASGSAGVGHGVALALFWIGGLLFACACLAIQQRLFLRRIGSLRKRHDGAWQADAVDGLPAAMGILRPVVVVPADFDTRYSATQRALMLAHERTHVVHGDLQVNACVAALRCVFWFNPLVHVAARALRQDQELACDARVIADHPTARRQYCEAMVGSGTPGTPSPLGCHWGMQHPLKERIAMLMKPAPSRSRRILGAALVVSVSMLTGVAAWAAQPQDVAKLMPPPPPAPPPAPALSVPPTPPVPPLAATMPVPPAPPPAAMMPIPPAPLPPPVPPSKPLPPPPHAPHAPAPPIPVG